MAQSPRTLEEQLKATSGFSDLTIVCQGVEFAAHRFIVCAHSQVLTAALVGKFSVSLDSSPVIFTLTSSLTRLVLKPSRKLRAKP